MRRLKQILILLIVFATAGTVINQAALADQSASANYQVNETFFGAGGQINATSPNYQANQTAGELATGHTGSASYQAQAGYNTNRTPYLEFVVNSLAADIGVLSSGYTKTANANFSVKAYLAGGYIVQTASDPPLNNGYALKPMTTTGASTAGQEQFGINLVANTLPVTFGANPGQAPDSSFGFGQAATGYNVANQYKYNKSDTIAYSNSSSGTTNYTISYVFNINNSTPSGTYILNQVLVATATY